MADIRINLLPWRAALREEKKQEFLRILVGVLLIAVLLIIAVDRYYNSALDIQARRSQYIEGKISLLQERIEKILILQQQLSELLERRRVIEELQGNRPIIVRMFDELVRQLSDGVFFDSVIMEGKTLTMAGVAKSNDKISNQLKNFGNSDWFERPDLMEIHAAELVPGAQVSEFVLTVLQSTPGAMVDNDTGNKKAGETGEGK